MASKAERSPFLNRSIKLLSLIRGIGLMCPKHYENLAGRGLIQRARDGLFPDKCDVRLRYGECAVMRCSRY